MTDETKTRMLQTVGVEPIGWPSVEEQQWQDELAASTLLAMAFSDPSLREGALRCLATFAIEELRTFILDRLDKLARGELDEPDDRAVGAIQWAIAAAERLRQSWSPTLGATGQMLDQIAEIAEAVRLGSVTGFYVIAQTSYESTRGWSAGNYSRPNLYFALGHAQHQLLVDSGRDGAADDEANT